MEQGVAHWDSAHAPVRRSRMSFQFAGIHAVTDSTTHERRAGWFPEAAGGFTRHYATNEIAGRHKCRPYAPKPPAPGVNSGAPLFPSSHPCPGAATNPENRRRVSVAGRLRQYSRTTHFRTRAGWFPEAARGCARHYATNEIAGRHKCRPYAAMPTAPGISSAPAKPAAPGVNNGAPLFPSTAGWCPQAVGGFTRHYATIDIAGRHKCRPYAPKPAPGRCKCRPYASKPTTPGVNNGAPLFPSIFQFFGGQHGDCPVCRRGGLGRDRLAMDRRGKRRGQEVTAKGNRPAPRQRGEEAGREETLRAAVMQALRRQGAM